MPEITIPEAARQGLNIFELAELTYRPPCKTCTARAYDECANCGDAICDECTVTCAGCGETDPWCMRCAITRDAFELRGESWYCENCPDFAPAYLTEGPE